MNSERIEWEEGGVLLPRQEYVDVRKTVMRSHNVQELHSLTLARQLHSLMSSRVQGKVCSSTDLSHAYYDFCKSLNTLDTSRAHELVSKGLRRGTSPLRPQKQWLKFLPMRATELKTGYFSITFDPSDQSIYWQVYEGTNAVYEVHQDPVVMALFDRLSKVQWTRGSGGTITASHYEEFLGEETTVDSIVSFNFG